MSAHTPGPWVAHQYGVRDAGGYICALKWPSLYTGQDERYWRETAERQADARLIAAAPDLLSIAREYLDEIEGDYGPNVPHYYAPQVEKIRAVIARATQP